MSYEYKDVLGNENFLELQNIAQALRERILDVVSRNGGHLSSALGAVDLIVGMHQVFNHFQNPFIFDVGHQAYAHKLLTGRWEEFESLRSFGGLSGFPNPRESSSDFFIAGHSSTAISVGVGVAKAFNLTKQDQLPIVLIGDGAMTAGLVYEALNELGERKYPMIIILNDNEMSISKPIGAISRYLSQAIASPFCQGVKGGLKKILKKMPQSASYMAKKFEESFKLITPGILFEELGLNYIGPIDGHNIEEIVSILKIAKEMRAPVLIHAQTTKGKGYKIAEGHFEKWHGVSPFDLQSGESLKKSTSISPTSVFSQTLKELAREDEKIVGVTAAMPSGTGMNRLIEDYPDRFWDVAIAEAHAVTSSSALAQKGFKPFVAIYSTFLQRAYDSIVHDVGIMNSPVRFAIDRAGIVGEDGETHQGLLDIAYLRSIPNFTLLAPRDLSTLYKAVKFAHSHDSSPIAFRYPRAEFTLLDGEYEAKDFKLGEMEILKEGEEIVLIGYGNGVGRALNVSKDLQKEGIEVGVVDLRFLKPLDQQGLKKLFTQYQKAFVLSDSYLMGGVGSALLEFMTQEQIDWVELKSLEVQDEFITHGKTALIEERLGLSTSRLVERIKGYL
ncbi:1-deoxy-D-xylulose-5-phosphate synthase [Helicobacter cholecystus]|uniref:1-deoxy-D-xylulose-5-phosphate synthase n=1 Tax=Helicobacter cholecystus TaxID=45498 RepID=A0A3D8IW89_9HELI|nr:1-deoxy-D-xylulose-5-phosphate synthase [Helicobacter cholecystus]RDU69547.1 1-deoxy-D-xylulose-5-phosphate synthase [Helicobacter cholecystus]VEJ24102.1 1-deoxy-D-xylulose-5-phosphate synthase [Helicobacter cholecystus]